MSRRLLTVIAALALGAGLTGSGAATTSPGRASTDPTIDNARESDPVDQHGPSSGHLPATSLNVQLVGKLRVHDAAKGVVADVGTLGNYAYLTGFNPLCATQGHGGVYVVDISDPTNPQEVGFIPAHQGSYTGEGNQAIHVDTTFFTGDILVHNNEICGEDGLGGFSLWDVTDPLNPQALVENFGDTDGGTTPVHQYHSTFIWQQGGKVYVVASDDDEQSRGDVDIFDVTDPTNPSQIGDFSIRDWPDAQSPLANGDTVFNHDMTVRKIGKRWTMLLSYWDAGYIELNVNDPAHPKFIGDTDFDTEDPEMPGISPPEGNGHYAEFDRGGRYFIGTDEDFSPYRTVFAITTGANAGTYGAGEFGWTVPLTTKFPSGLHGPTVFGGSGCEEDLNGNGTSDRAEVPPASSVPAEPGETKVVVFSRGVCFFSIKVESGQLAGYDAVIVGNSHAGAGNGLFPDAFLCGGQGHEFTITASAICIGHRAMHLLFNDTPEYPTLEGFRAGGDLPAIGTLGERISATGGVFDGWGYIHLYDAATLQEIDTHAISEEKDPAYASGFGNLTVHEVTFDPVVNLAYLSWYAGGFRVLSYGAGGMTEVGRFIDDGGNDFWGVQMHKTATGERLILASDRDSGLYVFRYTGPRP